VAMRVTAGVSTTVIYLHSDHLGSTSLTTDAGGQVVARVLYYPYGEERYTVGTLQTDYGYTGQRKNGYLDTYSMGARDYDPRLGRWLSADTIVPNPANSQSLNRYAYVLGNPLKYIDPTGHISDDPHERREAANIIEELSYYGVTIDVDWGWDGETWNEGSWLLGELNLVLQSVKDLAAKISEELDNDLKDWDNFRKVVGPVTIRRERSWAITPDGKRERPARTYGNTITLYNGTSTMKGPKGPSCTNLAMRGIIIRTVSPPTISGGIPLARNRQQSTGRIGGIMKNGRS
jgi:RHS repeat-associated protein